MPNQIYIDRKFLSIISIYQISVAFNIFMCELSLLLFNSELNPVKIDLFKFFFTKF
ncbi:hypothetical protein J500_1119 [Acinetobacter sp. 479375]|nr:hypothetical protein J500_1119 [Acinetobacter sp. 479375]BBF77835.1 hypothetical protein URS_1845 [Acinetobacter ursingii]